MRKSVAVLNIIAEELKMPLDSSLKDILACLHLVDTDGEVTKLLVEACKEDLFEMYRKEGIIQ
jgi:hypothetical protein